MKIAYVVSGMNLTFVVNEMEAHEKAGWQVIPLASCRPEILQSFSEVMVKWCKRAIYRPGVLTQMRMVLREFVTHPLRFLKMCLWMVTLLIHSPVEFAKAVHELMPACHFALDCRRFGVEHIHVHFASRSLNVGVILGILTNLPVSCTVHAFDIFTRTPGSLRSRLTKCKFIACISRFNAEYLRKICGDFVGDLCQVVRCGIDLDKFKVVVRKPEPGRLICVCRLIRKKGLNLAVQACRMLKDNGIDILFEIVGEGPEQERLDELIKQLHLTNNVRLLGPIPNDQLTDRYSRACAFVMPCVKTPEGDMDGIPVAMMEAMACEVPVVSRPISGIPELIEHGVNGLLVSEEDPLAIAEAVKMLITAPEKIRQFGLAACQKIEQYFNITETAAQLRELIQQYHGSNI